MNPTVFASLAAAFLLVVSPANAVTNDNGDILITQAAVKAGNITPGDAPGFRSPSRSLAPIAWRPISR